MTTYDTTIPDTFTKTIESLIRLNVPFMATAAPHAVTGHQPDFVAIGWVFTVTADYDRVSAP